MMRQRFTRCVALQPWRHQQLHLNTRALNTGRQRRQLDRNVDQSSTSFIPTCPRPTCNCADMPPDLDIERTKDLYGTMAAYSDHILISTGQSDWKSKIEDERNTAPWGELIGNVKDLLGPKGRLHNPYRNIVVSASSFEAAERTGSRDNLQALLFPSFKIVDGIKSGISEAEALLQKFVLPRNSATTHEEEDNHAILNHVQVRPIDAPTILICSHNSRDSRCGVLGPLLQAEFVQYINKRQTLRNAVLSQEVAGVDDTNDGRSVAAHPQFNPGLVDYGEPHLHPINVGMLSHIGGHKWAGNVIVYIPPNYQTMPLRRIQQGAEPEDQVKDREHVQPGELPEPTHHKSAISPLAGKGIWYGRVEPRHVEGIVEQTIGHGKVIRDLFRGGIDHAGQPLWL